MRSESEMLDLILGVAQGDERIRAVYMNGSRTNENVPKDIFQDYDIVYVVRENKPFYENKAWIDAFGERLYMQCPDELDRSIGENMDFDKCYGWLIQLADGNRIDLHVRPTDSAGVLDDRLCVVLLDKDGALPKLPKPTDDDYKVKKPNQNEFAAACNEFWWCLNNVAKGLWREEFMYVHSMLYSACHPQLVKLLNWKVGFENDFSVSTGKASKYLKNYLSDYVWTRFLKTYTGADIEEAWQAAFEMCDLFNEVAVELQDKYGLIYNADEANASYSFFKHVYALPKNATEIY